MSLVLLTFVTASIVERLDLQSQSLVILGLFRMFGFDFLLADLSTLWGAIDYICDLFCPTLDGDGVR